MFLELLSKPEPSLIKGAPLCTYCAFVTYCQRY
jgi:hypothetical protein